MRVIILSIHSSFADKIYSGEKRFEYRKRLASSSVDYVVLYETKPVAAITGFVEVVGKLSGSKRELWNATKRDAGITRAFFYDYFSESKRNACAYHLGKVFKTNNPISLSEIGLSSAPQSFRYIDEGVFLDLLDVSRCVFKPDGQLAPCGKSD